MDSVVDFCGKLQREGCYGNECSDTNVCNLSIPVRWALQIQGSEIYRASTSLPQILDKGD